MLASMLSPIGLICSVGGSDGESGLDLLRGDESSLNDGNGAFSRSGESGSDGGCLMKVASMMEMEHFLDLVFPLPLADDVRQWWMNEGDGKNTTWKELVKNFFGKFYPLSRDGKDEMLEEGDNWRLDLLEFISRVNPIFKNHRRVDGTTKKQYCILGLMKIRIKNR
nr:hypothetical protein [Tanacetum cinerariifolium]